MVVKYVWFENIVDRSPVKVDVGEEEGEESGVIPSVWTKQLEG